MHPFTPIDSSDHLEACSWHVLYTRHQHEKVVAQALSNKGFEVFLPLYSTTHRWKDRNKSLLLPLFPSYVFLRGGTNRHHELSTTPGVHMLIMAASRAAVVPEDEIRVVRKLVETCQRLGPHPFLRSGDWVRVKSGPLIGAEGILVCRKNAARLVISIKMLGKSAAADIDASMVEPSKPWKSQTLPNPPLTEAWTSRC